MTSFFQEWLGGQTMRNRRGVAFDEITDSPPERDRAAGRTGAHPNGGSEERQSGSVIAFHWGTVIAIFIAIAAIYARDMLEDKPVRTLLLDLHRQLGMLVLVSLPLRLIARWRTGHRDFSAKVHALLHWGARLSHWALYGLLFAIPLLGWGLTSAHGIELRLFGLVPLPGLVAPDSDLADELTDYHMWASYALMGMVFMHSLAALWHHYVLSDPVLVAMLPGSHRC
jgi:superoxide oxidase